MKESERVPEDALKFCIEDIEDLGIFSNDAKEANEEDDEEMPGLEAAFESF